MLRANKLHFETLETRTVLAGDASFFTNTADVSSSSTEYESAAVADSQTVSGKTTMTSDPLVKDFVNDYGRATGNDDLLYDLGLDALNDRLRMSDLDDFPGFNSPSSSDIDAYLQSLSDYVESRYQAVPF